MSEWRAKRGTLPKLSTFLSQLKGEKHFRKKSEKKQIFEKNLTMSKKKLKGGTLWDFPTSILTQNSKKIEGGPFGEIVFRKKSLAVPKKNEKGALWSRPVWYVTRKNRKNLFVSVR